MAIKSPKAKGSAGEREVILLLTGWANEVGVDLRLERNLEQVRHGGSDVNGVPGLEIEVKRVEANGINQWWAQVCRAAQKTGKTPFLAHRRNRQPWRFRIGLYSALYSPCGNGVVVPLVADLELASAKAWFQAHVQQHKENPDEQD